MCISKRAFKSVLLTHKCPPPGSHTHTVSRTGRELGPAGQLAVILTGKLTGLGEVRHRTGQLQTDPNINLPTILLPAGHRFIDREEDRERQNVSN